MIVTEFQFTQTTASNNVYQPKNAVDALKQAEHRRVDLIMMSDSNGLNGGYGFDSGFQYALSQHYDMYATGLISANQVGSGVGYKYSRIGIGLGNETGVPSAQAAPWRPAANGTNAFAYIANGGSISPYAGGLAMEAGCPINTSQELIAHFAYALWSTGGGTFQPAVKVVNTSNFYKTPVINPLGIDGEIGYTSLTIPAGAKPEGLTAKWRDDYLIGGEPQSQDLVGGNFVGYYTRIENKARTAGFSVSPLYSVGGHNMFDFANFIKNSTDQYLVTYFSEIRRLQVSLDQKPIVVFYVNTGVNDRGVNASVGNPTLGSQAFTSGTGAKIYLDNYEYIIQRVQSLWSGKGWDLSELFFLLVPSHVISNPDDATLIDYRTWCKKWATRANVQVVSAQDYLTFDEMVSGNYYDNGATGSIHLSDAGYNAVALKILENAS